MSAESTHAETVDHPDSSSHDPAGQIDPSLSVGGANDAALLDAQLVQLYESAMAAGGVPSLDDPTTGGSAGEGGVVDGAAAVKEEGDGGEDPSASVQGGDQPSGSSSGGDGSHQAGQYSSLFNGNLQGAAFEGLANYAVGPSAGVQNQGQASFAFNQPSNTQQGSSNSLTSPNQSSLRGSSNSFDMSSFIAREQMNLYAAQQPWATSTGSSSTAGDFAAFAGPANGQAAPTQPGFGNYPRGPGPAPSSSSLRSTSYPNGNYPGYASGPSGDYPDSGPSSKRKAEDDGTTGSATTRRGRYSLPSAHRGGGDDRDDSPSFSDRSYESSLSPAGSNYSDGGTPPPRSRKKSRHSEPKIGNESKSRKIKITLDPIPPELLAALPPALPRAPPADKPFACPECEKSFTRKNDLERHKGIHMDARPYKCEICQKAFRQPWHLKNHAVVHTGEQPYSCELCETRFTESGALRRHRRTHLDERPYPCLSCERRFKRKDGLKKHVESMHSGNNANSRAASSVSASAAQSAAPGVVTSAVGGTMSNPEVVQQQQQQTEPQTEAVVEAAVGTNPVLDAGLGLVDVTALSAAMEQHRSQQEALSADNGIEEDGSLQPATSGDEIASNNKIDPVLTEELTAAASAQVEDDPNGVAQAVAEMQAGIGEANAGLVDGGDERFEGKPEVVAD